MSIVINSIKTVRVPRPRVYSSTRRIGGETNGTQTKKKETSLGGPTEGRVHVTEVLLTTEHGPRQFRYRK